MRGRARRIYGKSALFEHHPQERGNIGVVLTDQDSRFRCDRRNGRRRDAPLGQIKIEGGANAFLRLETNLPAVFFDNGLADAQAQTRAALLTRIRGIGLCEFLEDVAAKFFGDAWAAITHGDANRVGVRRDGNMHRAVARRKLGRVRKQIREHLSQTIAIAVHLDAERAWLEDELHAELRAIAAIRFNRLLEQRHDFQRLEMENHLAGFDLFDVENIVNQEHEPLTVFVSNLDERFGLRREFAGNAADDESQRTTDRSQWCTQFVADSRDKFVFHSINVFAVGDIAEHDQDLIFPARDDAGFAIPQAPALGRNLILDHLWLTGRPRALRLAHNHRDDLRRCYIGGLGCGIGFERTHFRGLEIEHFTIVGEDHDRVGQRVQQRAIFRLAFAQCPFGLLALSNVTRDRYDFLNCVRPGIADASTCHFHPSKAATFAPEAISECIHVGLAQDRGACSPDLF